MDPKYIMIDRKIAEAEKEIKKLQTAKWLFFIVSIFFFVLLPVSIITFFVAGFKQKKLKRIIADLQLQWETG